VRPSVSAQAFYPRRFELYSSVDTVCVIRVLFSCLNLVLRKQGVWFSDFIALITEAESLISTYSSVQNDKRTEKTWGIAIVVVFCEYAPISLFRS
jgi:hypothetical protein